MIFNAQHLQYLIINPNTTQAVTTRLLNAAETLAKPQQSVHAVTAAFGAPYISTEVAYAVAGHAVLDAFDSFNAAAGSNGSRGYPKSVLIGCFGDPGLFALRERAEGRTAVTGLAEASFHAAAQHGNFAIVTAGAKWQAMLERLALALGFASKLQSIHTLEVDGAAIAALHATNPPAATALLRTACLQAATPGVQAIILGGAGLAGYAAAFAHELPVPLIDSVDAGVRALLAA